MATATLKQLNDAVHSLERALIEFDLIDPSAGEHLIIMEVENPAEGEATQVLRVATGDGSWREGPTVDLNCSRNMQVRNLLGEVQAMKESDIEQDRLDELAGSHERPDPDEGTMPDSFGGGSLNVNEPPLDDELELSFAPVESAEIEASIEALQAEIVELKKLTLTKEQMVSYLRKEKVFEDVLNVIAALGWDASTAATIARIYMASGYGKAERGQFVRTEP